MRHSVCEACGQSHPTSEMFTVFGRSLCETCGDQFLANRTGEVPRGAVTGQVDPTVCSRCKADVLERELPLLAGAPVCDSCQHELRHRPFPAWVKLSFAGLLGLAALSFLVNLRFFLGYVEMRRAVRAHHGGDIAVAAALMSAAAQHVPEAQYLKDVAAFYRGLELLSQDKAAEAVPLLRQGMARVPPEGRREIEVVLLQAEAGAAFDAKDYDTFLAKQEEILRRQPGDAMALAGVASAHACKYATTGEASHKEQALRYLEQATQREPGAEAAEYRQRILHRLETREIITRAEFHRRFPQGWHPEGAK